MADFSVDGKKIQGAAQPNKQLPDVRTIWDERERAKRNLDIAERDIETLKTTQEQLIEDNAKLAEQVKKAQNSLSAERAKLKEVDILRKELSIIKSQATEQIEEIQHQNEKIAQLEEKIDEQRKALNDHIETEEKLMKEKKFLDERVENLMKENLKYRDKIQQQAGEITRLLEESKQTDPAVKAIKLEFEKFRVDQQGKYEHQMKALEARQAVLEMQQNRVEEQLDKVGKLVQALEDKEKRLDEKIDAMSLNNNPRRYSPTMLQNRQKPTGQPMWKHTGKNMYNKN